MVGLGWLGTSWDPGRVASSVQIIVGLGLRQVRVGPRPWLIILCSSRIVFIKWLWATKWLLNAAFLQNLTPILLSPYTPPCINYASPVWLAEYCGCTHSCSIFPPFSKRSLGEEVLGGVLAYTPVERLWRWSRRPASPLLFIFDCQAWSAFVIM